MTSASAFWLFVCTFRNDSSPSKPPSLLPLWTQSSMLFSSLVESGFDHWPSHTRDILNNGSIENKTKNITGSLVGWYVIFCQDVQNWHYLINWWCDIQFDIMLSLDIAGYFLNIRRVAWYRKYHEVRTIEKAMKLLIIVYW